MQSWLSEDANAVTLILIDSSDNTVKAIRLIGVEPAAMKELKHACSEQIGWYIGAAHVDRAITEITSKYTTDDMLVHAFRYQIK